jgi:hypothetical protein
MHNGIYTDTGNVVSVKSVLNDSPTLESLALCKKRKNTNDEQDDENIMKI